MLGPYLHPRGRRSVAKRLAKLGVTVLEGPDATVTAVTRDVVQLSRRPQAAERGDHLDRRIRRAGPGRPQRAEHRRLGRLLTDETLTSVDDERIVAAGDSAAPSDLPLADELPGRGSAGRARRRHGAAPDRRCSNPAPIELGFAGQCISLGRRAGIFQFAHRNDIAKRFFLGGRPGAKLKAIVCWGTVKQLADEAHKPGSLSWGWSKDDKRQQLLRAKRERRRLAVYKEHR